MNPSRVSSKGYFKNRIAVEMEWNNKDPFYDRDLNNFRIRTSVEKFRGELEPRAYLKFGDTGDVGRQVSVTVTLYLEQSGEKHLLDTLTFDRKIE